MNNTVRRHTKTNYKRCAFTGYRPTKLPFGDNESDPRCVELKERLRNTIVELIGKGYAHFLSGGAQATDIFAAEAMLALKERYSHITLEMVSPFDGQADRWSPAYRARHDELFALADVVTVVSREYTQSCMFRRNLYLVTNADVLVAAYDGQDGGTKMTVELARREGVQVLVIPPVAEQERIQHLPVSDIQITA